MDSYVGALNRPVAGPSTLPAGLLFSYAPGILTRRSRGVTPLSVAPECVGNSKSRTGTRFDHCLSSYAQHSDTEWQLSSLVTPSGRLDVDSCKCPSVKIPRFFSSRTHRN